MEAFAVVVWGWVALKSWYYVGFGLEGTFRGLFRPFPSHGQGRELSLKLPVMGLL